MPKGYAFDTGFVSFFRGWDPLRPDEYGVLWEHLVLEYLQAHGHDYRVQYWRDAAGHDIDFVIPRKREEVDAIECTWDPREFDPAALRLFRSYYPRGNNFLVCPLTDRGYMKKVSRHDINVCNPEGWRKHMEKHTSRGKVH